MSDMIATRDGFGKELVEIGKTNDKIVFVSADLEDATRAEYFRDAYPDRFFTVGIAEQDMVGMAAGLALQGFTAVINSFAVFLTNRAYDMLRIDLCYNNTDVKVICSHAGVMVGEDGATAQCLEDFAIMRVLPNMRVICPVDDIETRKLMHEMFKEPGPVYVRTGRAAVPILTKADDKFEIGKANVLREGKDVTVIAVGMMVSEALKAAEQLKEENIDVRVVNMHTIKPIDVDCIDTAAKETGAIVTAEEHQKFGGLGSAVAEVVVQNTPVPMEQVAVNDSFGQTGTPAELLKEYGLTDQDIIKAIRNVIKRKK